MGVLITLALFLPIAAITGGVAGALVGGGREDRPIWKNAVIGIVGWTLASIMISVFTGESVEELTVGLGFLALLASAGFILLDEWWGRRNRTDETAPRVSPRRWAVFATVVGSVTVAIYITVVVAESNNNAVSIVAWASAMCLPVVLSLAGAIIHSERRARTMLLISAVLFLGIGVVSIFSVGSGFLAAGAMALFAANELPRLRQRTALRRGSQS